jgi:hypothetical protein
MREVLRRTPLPERLRTRKAATIPLQTLRTKEKTSPTQQKSLPLKATMAKTITTAVSLLPFTPPQIPPVDEADAAAALEVVAAGATLTLTATVEAAAVEAVAADGAEASEAPSAVVPALTAPEVLTTLLPRILPLTSPA